jgi:crotonobetainyl-CoA:carnitine CoA-transferase CaiB-like acyl-CoA transferase
LVSDGEVDVASGDQADQFVVVDFADDANRDRVRALGVWADVFITDLRQGAAQRLGVDHDALAPYNPRLVSVAISGFGERGPLRDLPGYEHILAAKAGRMASMNGYREGPIFTPTPIAAYGAAMLATQGALAKPRDPGLLRTTPSA